MDLPLFFGFYPMLMIECRDILNNYVGLGRFKMDWIFNKLKGD